MRLTHIEWFGFRVPFRRQYVTAGSRAEARHGLLLRLHTDEGIVGVGEASPVGAGDEQTVAQIAQVLRQFGTRLLDTPLNNQSSVHVIATSLGAIPATLRFGIESALYDLLGKAQRRPVTAILGGTPRPLPVNALIATDSPEEAARSAQEALAAGFTVLKIKVGAPKLHDDVRLLDAVRQVTGPKIAIRADANQAWSVQQAIRALNRLEEFSLEYVEQPVASNDLPGLAQVRKAVATPIAADEALASAKDAQRLIQMEAADIFIVKAARVGLLGTLEILRLAEKASKPVVVTSSLEAGVGIAASLHLAALLPPDSPACGLATGPLLASDLLTNPLALLHGLLYFPQGSGLGVDIDEEALQQYGTAIRGSIPA